MKSVEAQPHSKTHRQTQSQAMETAKGQLIDHLRHDDDGSEDGNRLDPSVTRIVNHADNKGHHHRREQDHQHLYHTASSALYLIERGHTLLSRLEIKFLGKPSSHTQFSGKGIDGRTGCGKGREGRPCEGEADQHSGDWELGTGNWELGTGDWGLGTGTGNCELRTYCP